ncbi:GHMP family kinase ATP-binding protein [Halorussus halophilus]|uniref:GHMP family kinase ATP-binding protein n=1 Tax=Halorussus halophilus TaxID=2650975 RepID=UPI0013016DE2|nr:GHMP kinase [Halorussus halophilus]
MSAFAPGSVTAIFAPADHPDESLGASFAIADGVVADVGPADGGDGLGDEAGIVTVDGSPTDFEPVELALDELDVSARVELDAEIPIGRGFGASGAATLATALAADAEFDLDYSREELVQLSHRAEVEAGTGLGDVFIQNQGGLLVGNNTGVERYDPEATIEYESYGGIDTSEVLSDDDLLARIEKVGRTALASLPAEPTPRELTVEGWNFARKTGLPTKEVEETVDDVESAGGTASMAMVGETVFAVGVEGVLDNRTEISTAGAELR